MEQRKLGSTGPTVSALGLGCMGMSEVYGPADRDESIATVHAALDAGITLLDTGDFYAMGHNELLVREALKGVPREKVQISVKYGALRGPAGEFAGMDTLSLSRGREVCPDPTAWRHRPARLPRWHRCFPPLHPVPSGGVP